MNKTRRNFTLAAATFAGKPVTPVDIVVKKEASNADAAGLRATLKSVQK